MLFVQCGYLDYNVRNGVGLRDRPLGMTANGLEIARARH